MADRGEVSEATGESLSGALTRRISLHMFLHAYRVRFRHPRSGYLLRFEAPLTTRLSAPLERARELLNNTANW